MAAPERLRFPPVCLTTGTRRYFIGMNILIFGGDVKGAFRREPGSACFSERRVIGPSSLGPRSAGIKQFGNEVAMQAEDRLGNAPFGRNSRRIVQRR